MISFLTLQMTVENSSKPLPINRYVIFRYCNVFYEGRIVDVLHDGNKTLYSVISFASFEYFRITEHEIITQTSLESKRKYKPSSTCGNFYELKMPSVLKNRLRADKDFCLVNFEHKNTAKVLVKITVKEVLMQFSKYFEKNSLLYDGIEMEEVIEGFKHLFNTFLPLNLLYKEEKEFFKYAGILDESVDYTMKFGPVYLLRLLYFIQRNNKRYSNVKYTQLVVSDFTVYLMDFLNYRYQDYFY